MRSRPLTSSELANLAAIEVGVRDYALLFPSANGLEKSILDATIPLRELLSVANVHDYSTQAKGVQNKVTLTCQLIGDEGSHIAPISLYRPATKEGDPCIWPSNLGRYANADDVLAAAVVKATITLFNLTRLTVARDREEKRETGATRWLDAQQGTSKFGATYLQWAAEIVRHFFGSQSAGQRVRLMVTHDVLDQNFASLGGTNGFLAAMLAGPTLLSHDDGSLHSRGLSLFRMWIDPDRRPSNYPKELASLDDAPPFLPYLCLLCLAWTEGGADVAPNAYYARLESLYRIHGFGGARLGDWLVLWKGLENWTAGLQGRRGRFFVELLGVWAHVGIPRSQVIFTPAKIERFPELFSRCGLESEASVSPARLRQLIIANENTAASVLGSMVCQEIVRETELGKSALNAIREHLENWDGELPSGAHAADAAAGITNNGGALALALRPIDDNSHWQSTLTLERNASCERVDFTARNWKVRPHSEVLATVVDAHGTNVDATRLTTHWVDGLTLHGTLREYEGDDPAANFKLTGKRLRTFDRWDRDILVESKRLPNEGAAYVLVHADTLAAWQQWLASCCAGIEARDVTWHGLPRDQRLFCLPDIGQLSAEARRRYPGGAAAASGYVKALRLTSGTRCNSSTARRVYAEYDPPVLIAQGPPNAELVVSGATATPVNTYAPAAGLPGNTTRSFTLKVGNGESVVVATLSFEGRQIGNVAFGVHRERSLLNTQDPTAHFDPLGNASQSGGISGYTVPDCETQWIFVDGHHKLGEPPPVGVWDGAAFKFIDSLSQQSGRLAYPEYKRRAIQIANIDEWRLSEETSWLAQLGHIDLETDSRGRWSYVHPTPLQIYLLPWLADGRYQFILTGSAETKRIEEITRLATDVLGCELRITQNFLKVVPPRITLLHHQIKMGRELAEVMSIKWTEIPPAKQLAVWAGGLDAWMGQVSWFPDAGPKPDAEYSPFQFRFVPRVNAPWHLRRIVDPITGQRWHCLYNTIKGQYAYIRDFSWAMWRVHMMLPDDDVTNLAYDATGSRLIVPGQLRFPYLLGRALSACSGLPPEIVYQCQPYMSHDAGVLLPEAEPFAGQCLAYPLVPRSIGEMIAAKVSARLVDVTL